MTNTDPPTNRRPARPKGKAFAALVGAASAAILAGGMAVASAVEGSGDTGTTTDPVVTVESTTTLDGSTTTVTVPDTEAPDTTLDQAPDTTVDEQAPDEQAPDDQADDPGETDGGTQATHPDNHGKDVSTVARDKSGDDGRPHGQVVSETARKQGGDSSTSTTTGADAGTSGHGRGRSGH